jgi:hypothetical protein
VVAEYETARDGRKEEYYVGRRRDVRGGPERAGRAYLAYASSRLGRQDRALSVHVVDDDLQSIGMLFEAEHDGFLTIPGRDALRFEAAQPGPVFTGFRIDAPHDNATGEGIEGWWIARGHVRKVWFYPYRDKPPYRLGCGVILTPQPVVVEQSGNWGQRPRYYENRTEHGEFG